MNETGKLVEQHIRESQLRLRHIDVLMARARQAQAKVPPTAGLEGLLTRTQQDRDRLAQHLDGMGRQPIDASSPRLVEQGEGLKGALEAAGLQLEQVLAAVFE